MTRYRMVISLAVVILCGMLAACASRDTIYGGGKFINIVNKSGSNLISIGVMTKKNNHNRFSYGPYYEDGVSRSMNINRDPVELTTISDIFLYYDDVSCNSFIGNMVENESIKFNEKDGKRDYGFLLYVPVHVFSQIGNHCRVFAKYDLNGIYDIFSKITSWDYYGYVDPSGRLIPVANRDEFFRLKRRERRCESEYVWKLETYGCSDFCDSNEKNCRKCEYVSVSEIVCGMSYYNGGGKWTSPE